MQGRWGTAIFLVSLALLAAGLNWNYYRHRQPLTSDEALMQQIVADLSNLPPSLGDPKAPVLIEVTIDPKHAGPCGKGTVEFVRQLVRDYHGKVQARFYKVAHDDPSCAAHLLVNGQKTFAVTVGSKKMTITLQGTARPGDPMSFYIRQIVEQEIAKASKGGGNRPKGTRETATRRIPPIPGGTKP